MFYNKFMRSNGLLARCIRGGLALAAGSVFERAAHFGRNLILARLLAPGEFGLMALVLAAGQLFETLSDVGVRQGVVQNKKGATEEYLNVAWWFSSARGLGLFIIGWLTSPWLASFYGEPQLTEILRVAFLAMVFNGLTSPGLFVLEKELRFGRLICIRLGSGLGSTVLSLLLAIYHPNVWALVVGIVIEAALRCLGSFVLCPIRLHLRLDRQARLELLAFSRRMAGVPILTYLFFNADIFVLGRFCSKDMLGYYSMALALATIPEVLFTRIAGPLVLPAFSLMQEQKGRLRQNLVRMTRGLWLFGLPMAACLFVFARPILAIAYGTSYAQVHWAFALLSLYIIIYVGGGLVFSTYLAIGRPELQRSFSVLRLVLMAIGLYPAVHWGGPTGAAAVKLSCLLLAGLWQLVSLERLLDLPIRTYLNTASGGMLLAVSVSIPALLWRHYVGVQWLQLVGGMVLCGLAWIVALWTLRGTINRRLFGSKTLLLED